MQPDPAAHAAEPDALLRHLGSSLAGLTAREAAARLRTVGPNALRPAPPTSAVRVLLAQLQSVVVLLLFVAAALEQADVGMAMGHRGSAVTKEASGIVLQDGAFPTAAAAVEEGRVVFDGIRRFVFHLFSCNLAVILALLGAGLAGLPLPLLPLQILWLNLATDPFPAPARAVAIGLLLQVLAVHARPLAELLGTVALSASDSPVVAALAAVPAVVGQVATALARTT